eukprot:m.26358 g.26358  ORF g.26358 m.26358 type:complete len:89 (-) comp8820_c0_seq2:1120-1386(-)
MMLSNNPFLSIMPSLRDDFHWRLGSAFVVFVHVHPAFGVTFFDLCDEKLLPLLVMLLTSYLVSFDAQSPLTPPVGVVQTLCAQYIWIE